MSYLFLKKNRTIRNTLNNQSVLLDSRKDSGVEQLTPNLKNRRGITFASNEKGLRSFDKGTISDANESARRINWGTSSNHGMFTGIIRSSLIWIPRKNGKDNFRDTSADSISADELEEQGAVYRRRDISPDEPKQIFLLGVLKGKGGRTLPRKLDVRRHFLTVWRQTLINLLFICVNNL